MQISKKMLKKICALAKAQMTALQTHTLATGSRFLLVVYHPSNTNIHNRTVVLHHRCDVYEHARDEWCRWLVQEVNYKRNATS